MPPSKKVKNNHALAAHQGLMLISNNFRQNNQRLAPSLNLVPFQNSFFSDLTLPPFFFPQRPPSVDSGTEPIRVRLRVQGSPVNTLYVAYT